MIDPCSWLRIQIRNFNKKGAKIEVDYIYDLVLVAHVLSFYRPLISVENWREKNDVCEKWHAKYYL